MKKYFKLLIVFIIILSGLTGCKKEEKKKESLDLSKMREISEFSTVKAYYHNVAKKHKGVKSGIQHIGEKERDYWIEYNGWVTIGIKEVNIEIKDDKKIIVTLKKPEILETGIENYTSDSVYKTKDSWFNSNEITKADIDEAINDANNNMLKKIKADTSLFARAENNAKSLIRNYINEIGKIYNETYDIEFKINE